MSAWRGCTSESLSLIYHSVEASWFNPRSRVLWEGILAEIGDELDRRWPEFPEVEVPPWMCGSEQALPLSGVRRA